MELRHFRYFVAVAEYTSFTKAAARLYISQPTLSQQVRQLERELGTTLFDREPGGVRLTAPGEVFYERACRVLAAVDAAITETRHAASEIPDLRVGIAAPLPSSIHLPVISAFTAAFPHIRIHCHELAVPFYDRALLDGDVDVAFLRPPLDLDRVVGYPILDGEPCALLTPMGHRFWDAEWVEFADFLEEPLLDYSPVISPRIRSHWLFRAERNDTMPKLVGEHVATNGEMLLSAGLNTVVVAAAAEAARGFAVPRFKVVELRGGPISATYIARRCDDTRPLPTAFSDFACRVGADIAAAAGM